MFKTLSIKSQIVIAFACLTGVFVVTLLVVGAFLSQLTQGVTLINQDTIPQVLLADEMDLSRSEVQQFLTDVAATHDRAGYKEADDAARRFQAGVQKFKQVYQNDPQNLQQINVLELNFNKFYATGKVMAEAYIDKGLEAGNLLMKGSPSAPGFDKDSEVISGDLAAFRKQQIAQAESVAASALIDAGRMKIGMIASGLAAGVLAALFGVMIIRAITAPLAKAIDITRTVASGDLGQRFEVSGSNETAQLLHSLKNMQQQLIKVVSQVRAGADGVASASLGIEQSDHDLSTRTENQTDALAHTTAAVHDLSNKIKQNAHNAQKANQLALNASSIAAKGGEVVAEVVETMRGINDSSNQIADIIQVIDGIAFQTNILALNAAVEAARAGEQGRGFAVVASEVRSLAGRSAAAAREIKTLIQASVERVERGTVLVDHAGTTMAEVVGSIRQVTHLMGDISADSNQQSEGVTQLGDAVTLMDRMTQQNAELVEEMAAAAGSLKLQADELVQTVAIFKLN